MGTYSLVIPHIGGFGGVHGEVCCCVVTVVLFPLLGLCASKNDTDFWGCGGWMSHLAQMNSVLWKVWPSHGVRYPPPA